MSRTPEPDDDGTDEKCGATTRGLRIDKWLWCARFFKTRGLAQQALRTYDTTFAAHQGWKQAFVIFHEDGNYFMVLDVPASAQFVDADGTPVPNGAPVAIRARVDSASVSFEFGPHGSYFAGSRPVVLWVYLKYVALGSGGLPDIWYQEDATEPWNPMSATADRAGNWLKVELRHFSNYAVAYRR